MITAAVAAQETVTVALHAHTDITCDGGTFRVLDAFIHGTRGILAAGGQFDGLVCLQVPGVVQVQVRDHRGQPLRIRQAGAGILAGVARDITGGLYRGGNAFGLEIRGTRRALAMVEVDRQAEYPVTVEFQRLGLAEPHGHRQPGIDAHACLDRVGTGGTGAGNNILHHFLEA